jgi:hypothetical protein
VVGVKTPMKVGILTFHDGFNYGAFFQVYCLQSFLLQKGFDCHIINYKSIGFTKREYQCFIKLKRPLFSLRNLRKIRQFKKAHKKLRLTERIFNSKKLSALHFDRIIIGSDEIWNFKGKLPRVDHAYFSHNLNADQIISYAASFGNISESQSIPQQLINALKRIEHISVRDVNSFNIMSSISNRPVEVVLDPTVLVDLRSEAILPEEEDFILIYGYFFSPQMISAILDYVHSTGRKTISVGYRLPWCDLSLDALSPFQWLGYFATCDCVITTMFHGMIYSILNHKDFCMLETSYRRNKVGNLLYELDIPGRMINENESIKDVFTDRIDFLKVDKLLEKKRVCSKEFLLKALKS